ncbi:hypothetical protein like AT5G16100 [Hibiscus trionum]|uniref:RWP-RK domain-containing protein n=1 Tax=Hibiscus trionum TaxID=183268 RepID=A0A9W7LV82_HIBTR|nr:hypothetical protein like AT5G16100 [Hibiscus trionum]
MADPGSIDPFNDPFDTEYTDDVLNILDIQNPTLDDLTADETPFLFPQSTGGVDDNAIDPLEDPVLMEFCNDQNPENYQAPTSNDRSEPSFETNVNLMPLPVWPTDAVPFRCSCCQSLREIIHTNGFDVTKLEIHGRLGMICHAILTIEPGPRYQMFDFCKKSIEDVKQFLIQYCIDRSQAGYMMIKDPLSVFYETLCVGFGWDENLFDGDFDQPLSSNSGGIQMDQAAGSSKNNREKPTKPSLAIQRERTRNLTLKEIEKYFHLPIEEAAKKLEFSATVVKKICRKYGLTRWPHRKIQSMEKQISNWETRLSTNDPEESARAEIEIQNLKREIAKFRKGSSKAAS